MKKSLQKTSVSAGYENKFISKLLQCFVVSMISAFGNPNK
jgi:hypothetical protein